MLWDRVTTFRKPEHVTPSRVTQCLAALLAVVGLGAPLLAPATLAARCSSAAAVSGLDPSIRAAAMGGASTAVVSGDAPDDWANPALLGSRRGVRVAWSRTALLPGLADDVEFRSSRLSIGGAGIGLSLAGRPGGLGGNRLDYGSNVVTDFSGNVIGTFEAYEDLESIGIGVNTVEVLDILARRRGRDLDLEAYGEIALGYAWKQYDLLFAPTFVPVEPIQVRGTASDADVGLQLRLTPYDSRSPGRHRISLGRPVDALLVDLVGGLGVDLGFARATRNLHETPISYNIGDAPAAVGREDRWGYSLHVATGVPSSLVDPLPRWLARFIGPLVAVTAAWDDVEHSVGGRDCSKNDHQGVEIELAGIVAYRRGRVVTASGEGATRGWGLGASAGGLVAVRYDRATEPVFSELVDERTRHGVTAMVDVLALVQAR